MRSKVLSLALACGVVSMTGCATIIQTPEQQIGFSSIPSNATVTVDGKEIGKTPINAKLSRKENHIVKLELDGFHPYEATLTKQVSGWVWGNIVFGGLIGLVIDATSGGMYKLTPDQMTAELAKNEVSIIDNSEGMYMAVVMEPKDDWQKVAQLDRSF